MLNYDKTAYEKQVRVVVIQSYKRILRSSFCYTVALLVSLAIGLAGCSGGVDVGTSGETPTNVDGPEQPEMPLEPVVDFERLAVHNDGFEGPYYSGSGQCSVCHDALSDADGNDVSIIQDWSTSMMANSARDPYWIAKVAAEMNRNPELKDELDDTCSRCHLPMANDTARKNNTSIGILDTQGFLDESNPLFDHAMEGVSCTLCHQVEDDGLLGTVEGVSGNFSVAIAQRRSDRPAYGPYVDPNGVRMQSQSEFNPVYGPHIQRSETCAACHDLRTPQFDNSDGSGSAAASFFPEQMIFSEWKNSAFAADDANQTTCQSCHMPVVNGSMLLASVGGGVPREGFSRHTFLGANTVMQSILMNNASDLGISVPSTEFEKSIQRNRDFLKTAASVEIVSSDRQATALVTRVRVRNLTGHKLPGGFASRRAFIRFVVTDDSGSVVFESGRPNSNGSVTGIATDTDSTLFEEHYDVISNADQVQVYEAIMGDAAEQVTHTLMNAASYLKDNRLLPAGFDKVSAPDDIKTSGLAQMDVNFDAGGDEVVYNVVVPDRSEYTISATLMYQPLAYGHLQDLFTDVALPGVSAFKRQFDEADLKFEILATDSMLVQAN